jgi:hypothetical protein
LSQTKPEISSSVHALATYYACYYQPIFSSSALSSRSSLLKGAYYTRNLLEDWPLPDTIETRTSTISEHHAVFALAKGVEGKEEVQNFVWLMAVLVTALDALPASLPADTVFVLSGVFGLVYSKEGGFDMAKSMRAEGC